MARLLCVGVAVADFVLRMDTFPDGPGKYRTTEAAVVGGGCAANAAVAAARLGGEVMLCARLGDDLVGDMILADLAREGVDCALADRAPGGRSSFSSVIVDKDGERQIVNFRGAGLAQTADWLERAPRPDAVLADSRWTEAAATALELARKWSVPGVLDAEAPLDPALIDLASHTAFSRPGLASVAEGAPKEALARLARTPQGWLAVTDGGDGTYCTAPEGIAHVPAPRVDAVDTLGAGDVWHGAFALRLGEGADEREAVRFANAAAALKCTGFGGRAAAPNRKATLALLEQAAPGKVVNP